MMNPQRIITSSAVPFSSTELILLVFGLQLYFFGSLLLHGVIFSLIRQLLSGKKPQENHHTLTFQHQTADRPSGKKPYKSLWRPKTEVKDWAVKSENAYMG